MNKEPLYLTVFKPGDGFEEKTPIVMSTPVTLATPEHQGPQQNALCKHGETETLLAGTPVYWQKKLARALIVGFIFGILGTIAGFMVSG